MFKKYIKILLVTILFIAMSFPLVSASTSTSENYSTSTQICSNTDIATTFTIAKGFLMQYYYAINLGIDGNDQRSFLDTSQIDSELARYLKEKIKTEQYVVSTANGEKENYKLDFTILDFEITNGKIFLSITTEATYNYLGLKIESGFGEITNMVFEKTDCGYVLIDWYTPYGYYDGYVRGYLEKDVLLATFSKTRYMEYAVIQEELREKIVNCFTNLYNEDDYVIEIEAAERNTPTRATLYALNKPNIVTYARDNIKAYPSSGNGVVTYFDFSSIPGNYDCTNFVSHALLAGGAVVYDTNNSGISPTGWYFRDISNRSSSWSGVPNLYSFLVNNYVQGPAGTHVAYTTFNWYLSNHPYAVGDILQFYQSGLYNDWRHSTIITEFYETSQPNVVGALVTGRTAIGQYNNNDKAELLFPGDDKRVIKLSGYYN